MEILDIDQTKVQALNEPDDNDEYPLYMHEYMHVHSCGVSSQSSHEFSRPDGSPDYMLNMIADGSIHYNVSDSPSEETFLATKGNLVIYKPLEPQYMTEMTQNITRYWIHFVGFGIPQILDECHLSKGRFYKVKNIKYLEEIFLKILAEMQSPSEYKIIKCNSYLLDLLSEMARLIDNDHHYNKQINTQLAPALKIINTQYKKTLNIDELAAMCYMSKYHFIRAFKEHTGCTPYSYLTNVRINAAKDLLKNTNINVGNISDAVGISDNLYFSKLFKKHTGKAPKEYRNGK